MKFYLRINIKYTDYNIMHIHNHLEWSIVRTGTYIPVLKSIIVDNCNEPSDIRTYYEPWDPTYAGVLFPEIAQVGRTPTIIANFTKYACAQS